MAKVDSSYVAEQAVLGGLMLDTSCLSMLDLQADHFTTTQHQEIFRAIQDCADKSILADAVTVNDILERKLGKDPQRLTYLANLVRDTPSVANIKAYADVVKRKADAHRARQVAQEMINTVDSKAEAIDDAIRSLMQLTVTKTTYAASVGDTIGEVIDYIDQRVNQKGTFPGLRTGLDRLDRAIGGMNKGHLIVVAARPGMGKTALMGGFHLANRDKPTGIMSTEQPRRELVMRMVSSIADVNAHDLKMGTVRDDQWPSINVAISMLKHAPIYINDRSAPSIDDIVRQARQWKYEHDIQLLSVDYLQRLRSTGKGQKRHEEVEYFARALKEISRELEIPVICLSQVSRDVEKRLDKRPLMSDLRDSGAIEAEADLIITAYRPEVYSDDDSDAGKCELSVIKNRHGQLGRVTVHFNGGTLTFSDFGVDGGDARPRRVPRGNGAAERQMGIGIGADN